jgi:hypothetical protein
VSLISKDVHNKETTGLRKNALYNKEMDTEVEKYVNFVMETFNEVRKRTPDALLLIEKRLDFSHLVEQGFGTGDVLIIADGVLYVIDLKYGKGIKVSAEKNTQLMLYGSGALREFELMYDIHTLNLIIVQPRLDNISTWPISTQELIKWGESVAKPAAEKAYLGKGIQQAGEHCKWCKVKAMCATLAAKNVAMAKHEFSDPHLLTKEQILQVYKQTPMLVDWANSVGEYILSEALKGTQWDGYKVVEGKSQRKWLDKEKVKDALSLNYKEEDYIISELAGIPAIETLIGKKDFKKTLGDLIVIPPGKPTLAPLSDKRPALGAEQAKEDFKDL